MSDYRPVPVEEAKRIADEFQKSMVVILAYDPAHELTHTTTYGVDAFDKEQAAAVGELCAQAVGCDLSQKHEFEDFHNDYNPALFKEAVEIFQQIRGRQDGSPHMVQRVERWLKAAGKGLRQA